MASLVRLVALGFLGTRLALQVSAQATTTATCTTDLWTLNKEGASPCLIAAALQAVCNNGRFTVPALPSGRQYLGPLLENANPCSCSTVTYCMVAACAACQGETTDTWTAWKTNCSANQVSVASYPVPIPSGVGIPPWAYLNVTTSNTWDSTAANAVHNAGGVESSASVNSATPTAAGGNSSSGNGTSSPSSQSSQTSVAAIAGGAAGGVVGLLLIGGLVFFLLRRNKRKRLDAPSSQYVQNMQPGGEKFDPALGYQHTPGSTPVPYYVNMDPGSSAAPVPKLYDPSDPSTFPLPQEAMPGVPGYASPAPSSATYGGTALSTSYGGRTPDPLYGSQAPSTAGSQAPPTPYGGRASFVSYSGSSPYPLEPSSPPRPLSQQLFGGSGYSPVPTAPLQAFQTSRTTGGAALGYSGTPEL